MKSIFVVVEGYTELEFVNSVLAPYLYKNGADLVKPFPVATNSALGKKGGGRTYKHLKEELLRTVKYNQTKVVTTLFDYYAFPVNSPSYEACQQLRTVDEKVACLENAIKEEVAPNNHRFIPYLQKHEFESLLFSSNEGFEMHFREIAIETQKIIDSYPNPEDINNNSETAPSKRLMKLIKGYNKELYGNVLALEIGIDQILEKCPRFNQWVEVLVRTANS